MFWEQRRAKRVHLKTPVTVDSASNFYTGFTENISEGGLFVATTKLRKLGERVRLNFALNDGGGPIEAEGIVRWVREANPSNDVLPGYGVQFVDLTRAAMARINAFIDGERPPLFYME